MTQKAIALTPEEERAFDAQHDLADAALLALLGAVPTNVDHIGVLYSLWVQIITLLSDAGWTAKELSNDLNYYVAAAKEAEKEAAGLRQEGATP
jgi:hypothetical protein